MPIAVSSFPSKGSAWTSGVRWMNRPISIPFAKICRVLTASLEQSVIPLSKLSPVNSFRQVLPSSCERLRRVSDLGHQRGVAPNAQRWRMRWLLGRALVFLVLARALVRFVPFSTWRSSLGAVVQPTGSDALGQTIILHPQPACDEATLRHAMQLGRLVDRAAEKLPGTSKCLPRAAALQWLLLGKRIPSSLVIAFRLGDRSGPDGYHAWTEAFGEMLVGHCNRSDYRPIMALCQPPPN